MKRQIISAIRRNMLPIFLSCAVLAVVLESVAPAQSKSNYCEPEPEIKKAISEINVDPDGSLPYRKGNEKEFLVLRELLKKYPENFFVRRRYQDVQMRLTEDREELIKEYRAQKERRTDDPTTIYLYSKLLIGRQTREAIENLEKLAERSPDFPWTYLSLAEIYSYPNFRDAAKLKNGLRNWMSKCPAATDGIWLVLRHGDQELLREAIPRLRALLESAKEQIALFYWNELWGLEFKLKPVSEHSQVRQQIAKDLERLRAKNLNSQDWLSALRSGYKMVDDKKNLQWAEAEAIRLFPKSTRTRYLVRARWNEEHPQPNLEESAEKRQAYNQALFEASGEWLKRWPDDASILLDRFQALEYLDGIPSGEVEATAEKLLKALEQNRGAMYTFPPVPLLIADLYLKRNIALERIPALVQRGLEEGERNSKRDISDLFPERDTAENDNLKYLRWRGWSILVEAYGKLKQPDKAREILAQMAESLKTESSGQQAKTMARLSHLYDLVTYWTSAAKLAEIENRKLDALMCYQTAFSFRPKSGSKPQPGAKDALMESAQRLWKELGGTDEGWNAYANRNESRKIVEEAIEAAAWDAKNQPLPDFTLLDLQGKKWQLADLKGKTAFINIWATWCGPCKAELPYVQKLHEQMKDRKDVVVLTFNIDDEIGLIDPFMKENKYTFTVVPAHEYAENLGVLSVPRNWLISNDGTLRFEGIGFDHDGDSWMKKALELIEKTVASSEKKKQ